MIRPFERRAVALAAALLLAATPAAFALVQPASGDVREAETDHVDQAAHALTFTRHYRSSGNVASGLGPGWSHNWAATLAKGEFDAAVRFGTGRNALFARGAANEPWQSSGQRDRLVEVAGGTQFSRASDESLWTFNAAGQLQSIRQRNGWTASLSYNASGQLERVTNAFGRSLQFTYNGAGQLQTVRLADGSVVGFGHDGAGRLQQATAADGAARTYHYEDARNIAALTGISAEGGARYVSYTYDEAGRATAMQYAGLPASSYRYDTKAVATGQLVVGPVDPSVHRMSTTARDALGREQTLTWQGGDGQVRLIASDTPLDGQDVASRTLGALNLPATETDFAGVQTTHSWDSARQLPTATTRAAGLPEAQTTQTQWHASLRLPTLITEAGRSTAYEYDALGNPLTLTITDTSTGQPRTWRWTYTSGGLPETMTDPKGGVWRYGYDSAGNRTSAKDPLGRETTYTHDAAGRVLTLTEPGGLVTVYTYDARGRLVREARGAEVTSYSYLPPGLLRTATLANGYQVNYGYDAAQRLTSVQDNRGASITYSLDAAGNRIREEIRDGGGNLASVTARVIDSLGRVSTVQGATGQSMQLAYDANGSPVSQTDPLNQTTRHTLDGLRRATATTFADNATAQQGWNALDQLTQITDPKGVRTTYETNAFGEVTSETSTDIGTLKYTRDANGDVVRTEDAKGQINRIERDALGRVTRIEYGDGKKSFFSYTGTGDLSTIENASGRTSYERDAQGRITLKTQAVNDNPSSPSSYRLAYAYTNGDLTGVTYPSGLKVTYKRQAGRIVGIDAQAQSTSSGKVTTVTVPLVADLTHTALGQPKSWRWFNGDTASRSFDADGRMASNEFATYIFDAAGRITGITQTLWTDQASGTTRYGQLPITWTASYDNRNRLVSFTRSGAETRYTYDANGNRLTALDSASGSSDVDGVLEGGSGTQTHNQTLRVGAGSNRLLGFDQTLTLVEARQQSQSKAAVGFQLDANGAMTSDGLRQFEYDAAQRLSKVRVFRDGEAASVIYLHNELGQRVFKSQVQADQTLPTKETLGAGFIDWLKQAFSWVFTGSQGSAMLGQAFLYGDGEIPSWALLGEYDNGSATGSARTEYVWLPTESGAIPVGIYRDGRFYAVHTDHLGTPRYITDDTKRPVWQWASNPFGGNKPSGVLAVTTDNGQVKFKATNPVLGMPLRYSGQYADSESGLLYNYSRSYQAGHGRYVQFDPIGLAGGLNGYLYVDADPLNGIDPLGLQTRTSAPSTSYGQTLLNFQATNLIRDIRQYQSNFSYATVSRPGAGFTARDVANLQSTLQMLQAAQSCPRFPNSPAQMDALLGFPGTRVPDTSTTQGRGKVVWHPNSQTKITFEQHPYHPNAPEWHRGPHFHVDTPGRPHERFLPGDPMPGY